jgi:type VI secretion system secreted protein Hcp
VATDIFLKLGDIKGESTDERHKDEIELISWTWGVAHATPPNSSSHGAGRATFQDFVFVHHLDKASPRLMQACATGQHIPQGVVSERKAGASAQEFLVITFTDVIITSVQPSAASGGDAVVEQVGLQAGKVDLEYKAQRPDGSLDEAIAFKFDIAANKPL